MLAIIVIVLGGTHWIGLCPGQPELGSELAIPCFQPFLAFYAVSLSPFWKSFPDSSPLPLPLTQLSLFYASVGPALAWFLINLFCCYCFFNCACFFWFINCVKAETSSLLVPLFSQFLAQPWHKVCFINTSKWIKLKLKVTIGTLSFAHFCTGSDLSLATYSFSLISLNKESSEYF